VTTTNPIIRLSVEHPWWVITVTALVTLVFAIQLPRIKIDTDRKRMLPITSQEGELIVRPALDDQVPETDVGSADHPRFWKKR
jgi:uncharacterized membrane protein YdfJ with MMPL/SSD domain